MPMERSGGHLVVEALQREGVRALFTVPGESFLPVLDGLFDAADAIDVVTTRHESGAGFMAEGYAKSSGEVGVCMVTRGVGLTNLSIALHTAMQDSTPVVAFVGQVPSAFRFRESFQEVDLPRFMAPLVKWAIDVPATDRIGELVQQAFRVARSERQGPVVVGLPEDVLYGTATSEPTRVSLRPEPPRPSKEAVARVARALTVARRPLLVAGREVLTSQATDVLVAMSEASTAPVMTTFRRYDAFPNDHVHYVGSLALGVPKRVLRPIVEADLVVALGTRFDEITTQGYEVPAPGTTVVHVSASPAVAGVFGHDVDAIVADVSAFLHDLIEAVEGTPAGEQVEVGTLEGRAEWIQDLRGAYERLSTFDPPDPRAQGVRLSAAVRSIVTRAPERTAITTDAGNFSGWVTRYVRFRHPRTHFGPVAGAMGYGLPSAIGAAFADRSRMVFALAGDGGFAMTMSELAVVAEHRLPVVSVVFVNDQYGTIRMHQQREYPGRRVATSLHNPSFRAIGEAFGIDSFTVEDDAAFDRVVADLVARPRPALIEVMEGDERLTVWGNLDD